MLPASTSSTSTATTAAGETNHQRDGDHDLPTSESLFHSAPQARLKPFIDQNKSQQQQQQRHHQRQVSTTQPQNSFYDLKRNAEAYHHMNNVNDNGEPLTNDAVMKGIAHFRCSACFGAEDVIDGQGDNDPLTSYYDTASTVSSNIVVFAILKGLMY